MAPCTDVTLSLHAWKVRGNEKNNETPKSTCQLQVSPQQVDVGELYALEWSTVLDASLSPRWWLWQSHQLFLPKHSQFVYSGSPTLPLSHSQPFHHVRGEMEESPVNTFIYTVSTITWDLRNALHILRLLCYVSGSCSKEFSMINSWINDRNLHIGFCLTAISCWLYLYDLP